MWNERALASPSPYHDPKQALRVWPSQLTLDVRNDGGRFDFAVTVFNETWLPLPGDGDMWPVEVTANDAPLPVVEHKGKPARETARRRIPHRGSLALAGRAAAHRRARRRSASSRCGSTAQPVESPAWDAQGFLWLKRDASTEQTDKDFLGVKVYSLLEDGIPLWLRTEIELIVSGKSREEVAGPHPARGLETRSAGKPDPGRGR